MRQRLNDHLGTISKSTDRAEHVQIHPNRLSKPSAICAANNDLLFCSGDESEYVYQITLTFDGVVTGLFAFKSVKIIKYIRV